MCPSVCLLLQMLSLSSPRCYHLACLQAGQPYALDPRTLETRGLDLLGGRLSAGMVFDLGSDTVNRVRLTVAALLACSYEGPAVQLLQFQPCSMSTAVSCCMLPRQLVRNWETFGTPVQ